MLLLSFLKNLNVVLQIKGSELLERVLEIRIWCVKPSVKARRPKLLLRHPLQVVPINTLIDLNLLNRPQHIE